MSAKTKLRFMFIIQGEGRGHMTQALALKGFLDTAGHEVCCVMVGSSQRRQVPDFFKDGIRCPIGTFASPNFKTDSKDKGIRILPTITSNMRGFFRFARSVKQVQRAVLEYKPDMVINFFDLIGGIFSAFNTTKVPVVCIGHQYMFHHPGYSFPDGLKFDRFMVRLFTRLTSLRAKRRFALSFYRLEDLDGEKITVVPPILRDELFGLKQTDREDFLLAYVVNRGYAEDIKKWHAKRPEVTVHCFWDSPQEKEVEQHTPNLYFHRLSNTKFLDMMNRCQGVVCTAGFESVAESMYLGKPVFMVPIKGHFEQIANAADACGYGAGMQAERFCELDEFVNLLANADEWPQNASKYKSWVDSAESVFISSLEQIAAKRGKGNG